MKRYLIAQLWAMSGPSEGKLVYGVLPVGTNNYELFECISDAIRAVQRGAVEVREFWQLP